MTRQFDFRPEVVHEINYQRYNHLSTPTSYAGHLTHPSIHRREILQCLHERSAAFSVPSPQRGTTAGITCHIRNIEESFPTHKMWAMPNFANFRRNHHWVSAKLSDIFVQRCK
jgi:hypothetical protein